MRKKIEGIPDSEYWKKKGFKTDTIFHKSETDWKDWVMKEEQVLKAIGKAIPPKEVQTYPTPYNPKISLNIRDSLIWVYDSLKKKIDSLSVNYITNYPNNPKLIFGKFSKSELSLSFLKPDGNIYREKYPIDYSRYNYTYTEQGIQVTKQKFKLQSLLEMKAYAGMGYEFSTKEFIYTDAIYDFRILQVSVGLEKPLRRQDIYLKGKVGLKIR